MTGGATVILTRERKDNGALREALVSRGVSVVELPAIATKELSLDDATRGRLSALAAGECTWLVFTSAQGVRSLKKIFPNELPRGLKVAAIGAKTGEVIGELFARKADLVPAVFTGEELLNDLLNLKDLECARFLFAVAKGGRDVVQNGLRKAGAKVDEVFLYESVAASADDLGATRLAELQQKGRLIFTFFSPSAVKFFVSALADESHILRDSAIVTIGPVTSEEVRRHGLRVTREAEQQSDDGVLHQIETLLREAL